MTPDLDALAMFLSVVEAGSLGRAAERLGTTQPSLSRRMTALERDLGVPLLDRTPRGSRPTPTGRAVAGWAADLLASAEAFGRNVDTLSGRGGSLRLAVSMTIAEEYVADWLAELRRREPGVEVALSVGNSTEVAALVRARTVELGLVESPDLPGDLLARRIGSDPLAVAVAGGHPWAAAGRCTVADLAATPLLVREAGSGTRSTLERALAGHGAELRVAMEVPSNAALRSAAKAGLGPVVVSRRILADDLRSGALVDVEVDGMVLERPLTALVRTDARMSRAAEALLDVQ